MEFASALGTRAPEVVRSSGMITDHHISAQHSNLLQAIRDDLCDLFPQPEPSPPQMPQSSATLPLFATPSHPTHSFCPPHTPQLSVFSPLFSTPSQPAHLVPSPPHVPQESSTRPLFGTPSQPPQVELSPFGTPHTSKHELPSPATTPHASRHVVLSPLGTPQPSVHDKPLPRTTPHTSWHVESSPFTTPLTDMLRLYLTAQHTRVSTTLVGIGLNNLQQCMQCARLVAVDQRFVFHTPHIGGFDELIGILFVPRVLQLRVSRCKPVIARRHND